MAEIPLMNSTSNDPDIRPAGLIFHLIIQETARYQVR
jgi:hypothetical protein